MRQPLRRPRRRNAVSLRGVSNDQDPIASCLKSARSGRSGCGRLTRKRANNIDKIGRDSFVWVCFGISRKGVADDCGVRRTIKASRNFREAMQCDRGETRERIRVSGK